MIKLHLERRKKVSPPYQEASIGDTVAFSCTSDNPVTWTHDGGPLLDNVEQIDAEDGEIYHFIRIVGVLYPNAGAYRCLGDDGDVIFEDEGVLSVGGNNVNIVSYYICSCIL